MNPENSAGPKCHLSCSGDLAVEGRIDGEIEVENALTIGPNGMVEAQVFARVAMIQGSVRGVVTADKVVLAQTASLQGDIVAPRLVIAEGAFFSGTVNVHGDNGNGNGNGNGHDRDATKSGSIEPALVFQPGDASEIAVVDEFRAPATPDADGRTEPQPEYAEQAEQDDAVRAAEQAPEAAAHQPVKASPSPRQPAPRVPEPPPTPAGSSVAPYWKRAGEAEAPVRSRPTLGRTLFK